MHLLRDSEYTSKLDSVYLHKDLVAIVMKPHGVVYTEAMDTAPALRRDFSFADPRTPYYPGFSGGHLIHHKQTKLTEKQVCKVMSHLLGALMALLDLNMCHWDLSLNNFLVDDKLDVCPLMSSLFSRSEANTADHRQS